MTCFIFINDTINIFVVFLNHVKLRKDNNYKNTLVTLKNPDKLNSLLNLSFNKASNIRLSIFVVDYP